jgi:hypothetical protein
MKTFIIGIAGNSRSGKDTLARILKEKIENSDVFSLAFYLRKETEHFLRDYGHNVWSQKSEEKEKFRNYLVEYAEIIRQFTKGQYFWKKLEEYLKWHFFEKKKSFAIISDVRFDEFESDEVWWVKQNGVLVFVDGYQGNGIRIPPANKKEAENEQKLIKKADFTISWVHKNQSDEEIYQEYKTEIDKITNHCLK